MTEKEIQELLNNVEFDKDGYSTNLETYTRGEYVPVRYKMITILSELANRKIFYIKQQSIRNIFEKCITNYSKMMEKD